MKKLNLIKRLWTDSHEKQKMRGMRRYAAMLLLLLTCVTLAWATPTEGGGWCAASGAHVYFDNTNSSYTNVSILIGRQWDWGGESNPVGSWGENFSLVSGTNNLYYKSISQDHYTTFCFINAADWGWEKGNTVTSRLGWCTNTDTPNDNLGSGTHLYVPASGSDNASVTHTTPASYTALNYTQTLNQKLSTDGGSTFSTSTASIATVTVSSNKLNGNNSTTSDSGEIGTGESSTSCLAARTATVTYEVDDVATGYTFVGWYDGNTQKSTNTTYTYNAIQAKTITARFKEDQYSLTFSHNGHGSIAVGGNTVSSGSTANVNYFTTMTLVASPSTGYNFSGWTKSGSNTGSVTIGNAANASTTIKATNTGATVTAGFTAKTYSITLDDDGDYQGSGSATATYNSNSLSIASHASRTDYRIEGYFAPGTGDQVTDASGNLLANKTGNTGSGVFNITDASGNWVYDGDLTLYAHWIYDVTEYAVTFAVGTSYTSLGSLTAYNNTTSSAISSGANVRSGQSVTFTAAPNTGYAVEGWYTNAACTEGKHSAGSTTYTTSIGAATNVYVKFVEKTWSVAFAAGTGGTVTTPAATPQTVGQITGISIAATPATGYTFNSWSSSNGGSFTSGTSTNSNTFKPTANTTVTASFSEIMRSITISGGHVYGGAATSTTAGVATAAKITANDPATGKKFTGWSLGDGVSLKGGYNLTDQTIEIYSTANATVTATYANRANVKLYFAKPSGWSTVYAHAWGGSDPSTKWPGVPITGTTETINHVVYNVFLYYTEADGIGNAATGSAGWTSVVFSDEGADSKKTADLTISNGHYYFKSSTGTGKAAALTSAWCIKGSFNSWSEDADQITHGSATAGSKSITLTTGDKTFKIYNIVNETWWRFSGDVTASKAATAMNNADGNMTLTPSVAGPYTFALGSLNGTPTLAITYPVSYTLTYSIGSVAGTSGTISSSPSTSSGSKVISGSTITLTAPSEKTGYTWKGWYGAADGSGDQLCSTKAYAITMNANKTVYACYTENQYNETVSVSPAGYGTTTPSAGTVAIKQVTGTSITANPGDDYAFVNWTYSDGGITASDATNKTCTFKATSTGGTITANFTNRFYLKGSAEMGAWSTENEMPITATANTYSVTLSLAAKTTYDFKVFNRHTGAAIGASSTTLTRGTNSKTGLTTAGGDTYNIHVTTDAAGNYTFKYLYNAAVGSMKITVEYPEAYTVTYGAGTINGSNSAISVSPSFTSGDYVLPSTAVTFSKGSTKAGYTWKGWYSNVGGTGDAWSTTDANWTSAASTRSSNISVYACYNFITYSITYNLNGGSNPVSPAPASSFNVETSTITLPTPTRTGYTFNGWYANSDLSTGGVKTQIAKGTHENQEFWAKWTAKDYTITLNCNGATSTTGVPASVTATYDAVAAPPDGGQFADLVGHHPSRTGYTFGGWYTNNDGTGTCIITSSDFYDWGTSYVDATGHWIHDGNIEVFAKWTPNNYAVTLSTESETGYGSNAPANQTATYGADMPTITPPVGAAGYKFQGYFTEANGSGTKYYNADGTSAHAWDIASATTLHAYFLEAEITSLEHETSVAKAEEAELVVNPVLNVVPEDYIAICWTLHYADNDNPVAGEHWSVTSYTEGGTKPNQVKYTFTNLASGSYYVKATLRKSASTFSNVCTDGTKMMDIHGDFHVVGNNTVTVRYMTTDFSSDFALKAPTEVEVEAMRTAEITAPEIPGYTFNRWYLGDGISKESGDYTSATITISATYDGVITARYAKKQMVYFNNTLGWEDVYVYFYNDASGNQYWTDNYGTGANKQQPFNGNKPYWEQHHGHMTQIEGTNIWYFDFKAANYPTRTKVAFANVEQSIDKNDAPNDEAYFHNASVVYRTDFDASHLPMFVPINSVEYDYTTNTGSKYYRGYWMNYPESTGYELRFYNKRTTDGSGAPYELISKRHKFEFTGDKTLPLSVSLDLEAGHDYYFKIYRVDGTYYGNNNQMTNGHSGDEGQPAWEFKTGTENAWVTASGAGNYTFTLTYGIDLSSNYNYLVGVRYPESTGDFRVLYSDAVRVTNHGSEGASWLASYVIPKTTESDTVSFFVRKASTPKIKAQKCTATYDEGTGTTTVTWTDENEGADLLPDTISADGVYNFIFTKRGDNLELSAVEPYTGNFYIRVDGAGTSNWDNFRSADHLMPYSDYSFKQEDEPYSHYFTQWYEPNPDGKPVEPKNIKFVVANDYSACVSDTIVRDGIADIYVDENGWLSGRNANIRFMYNYKTNAASRRYIDGAQEYGSEFLVLIPEDNDMIYDAETEGTAYTQVTFTDKGNWLYEANVWVVPGTTYKLKSNFGVAPNLVVQYFKGAESGAGEYETLIGGSGSSRLQIRLLYDFKTNRIVSAYVPSSTLSSDLAINADVMFIRNGQGEMQQLTFENNATLSAIKNVYSVLRFNKWTLNNRYTDGGHGLILDPKSIYERSLYFVSFPFDVKLSDVFGFGTYWDEWYIEYYDGAARAKNGFWIDSDSYWKYVTPAMKDTFTLKAGQGYIFGLDLDYLHCEGEGEGQQANVWKNIQTADFIFPGNVSSISNSSVTYTLPAHTCTINRGTASGNRTIADSHWNVLGVPTYLNTTSVTFEETTGDWMTDGKPKYIYSWNPQDNSLTPTSAAGFTYHSMNAYVVQYYGNVTFSTSVSAAAAPRRNPEYRGEYEFRLEIQKNDEALDQTYVRLSDDEEVTANFEFGYDLTKAQTGRAANLYTIIEGYLEAAGNTLPLTNQTTIVPVGVKVNVAGDFTFSMPDGTEGIGVTLIDNETGISTQLSALDYTINLAAGTYNNRFLLVISPIVQNPTGIEDVTGDESQVTGARKVMIDGLLYIVKDGKMFDATGALVK